MKKLLKEIYLKEEFDWSSDEAKKMATQYKIAATYARSLADQYEDAAAWIEGEESAPYFILSQKEFERYLRDIKKAVRQASKIYAGEE